MIPKLIDYQILVKILNKILLLPCNLLLKSFFYRKLNNLKLPQLYIKKLSTGLLLIVGPEISLKKYSGILLDISILISIPKLSRKIGLLLYVLYSSYLVISAVNLALKLFQPDHVLDVQSMKSQLNNVWSEKDFKEV